jgi:hypothetical protein
VSSEWIKAASADRQQVTHSCDDDFSFVAPESVLSPETCPNCGNSSSVIPVPRGLAQQILRYVQEAEAERGIAPPLLKQYALVRIRRLWRASGAYDGWKINKRPPEVGDVGTILDVLREPLCPDRYVVECSGPNGIDIWLGDFSANELEPVE